MKKVKYILMILFASVLLLLIPNFSNAAIDVTKNIYANNGSAKYEFTGLTLDSSHDYEFGLTKTASEPVENWHLITEHSDTSATVDISGGTKEFVKVITAVEKGYISIRDKSNESIIVEHHAIDLSIPYLNITNYTVINNGKSLRDSNNIHINFWNHSNCTPYYQYEKITDENVISRYKEIKAQNGDFNNLQSLLKTNAPSSNWKEWDYWNGYDFSEGTGYPEKTVNVPDNGLYYMWIYLAGNNIRNLFGYILVDNLQPDIALDSISLPKTKEVELGKTLTLKPTFSPENTTNKIVTWNSSDESVATVDNAGNITPKKLGSTIITVTSQDGNKKASCTVTVIQPQNNTNNKQPSSGNNNETTNGETNKEANKENSNNGANANGSNSSGDSNQKDSTVASGKIPQTGFGPGLCISLILVGAICIVSYLINKKYKDI